MLIKIILINLAYDASLVSFIHKFFKKKNFSLQLKFIQRRKMNIRNKLYFTTDVNQLRINRLNVDRGDISSFNYSTVYYRHVRKTSSDRPSKEKLRACD